MDDSQHIFPIDLLEDKPRQPSPPEKNSKNRHENEPNEDTQHLKFFPNRENEENQKKAQRNKEEKKSKNQNQDVPDTQEPSEETNSPDVKPKPKIQDWKSGLVLGESDIIKKLYSPVPEAKVYEVGNSIGRFLNQSENRNFSILDIMRLHWNLLHFPCDHSTHKRTNLIIVKLESRISLRDCQARVSHWLKDIGF